MGEGGGATAKSADREGAEKKLPQLGQHMAPLNTDTVSTAPSQFLVMKG